MGYLFLLPANSPYYAFQQSDSVGKAVVVMLFIGSIITWTIMVEKGMSLKRARANSEKFMREFRGKRHPLHALRDAKGDGNPVASVFLAGAGKLMNYYGIAAERAPYAGSSAEPLRALTANEVESLRSTLEQEVADQILALEDKIGVLATAVSVSPFLGLFGTVWGVMMAFCGIAIQGRADISALAPGVSGALLTTVVALMVAIPSLVGYNMLTINIRKLTVHMDNFVEEMVAKSRSDTGK